jgi:type I restriction enzyme, S subunit
MTPLIPLGQIAVAHYGKALKEGDRDENGSYPVFGSNGEVGRHSQFLIEFPTIVIGRKGSVGAVTYAPDGGWPIDTSFYVEIVDPDCVDLRYLYWALMKARLGRRAITTSIPGLNREELYRTRIPLPPLDEQRHVAATLDLAEGIQRKRRETLRLLEEFLSSAFLELFGNPVRNEKGWPVVRLGDAADFFGGGTPSRGRPDFYTGTIPWASSKDIIGDRLFDTQEHVTREAIEESATKLVPAESILVVVKSKILLHRLPVSIAQVPLCFSQDVKAVVPRDHRLTSIYLARHIRIGQQALLKRARGANTEGLTLEHLRGYEVMVPPTEILERWKKIEERIAALRNVLEQNLFDALLLFESVAQQLSQVSQG